MSDLRRSARVFVASAGLLGLGNAAGRSVTVVADDQTAGALHAQRLDSEIHQ
jgi:hypothetical protein